LKYVSKPVVTDAWQFTGTNWDEIKSVTGDHKIDVDAYRSNFIPVEEQWVDVPEGIVALVWVAPSHQWAGVKTGDYIVQDYQGDFYPCDRQIFERKYEELSTNGEVITSSNATLKSIQQSRRFGNIG
jgi:hypothetical protein